MLSFNIIGGRLELQQAFFTFENSMFQEKND